MQFGLSQLSANFDSRLFGKFRGAHFGAVAADSFYDEAPAIERNRDFVGADIDDFAGKRRAGAALQTGIEEAQ